MLTLSEDVKTLLAPLPYEGELFFKKQASLRLPALLTGCRSLILLCQAILYATLIKSLRNPYHFYACFYGYLVDLSYSQPFIFKGVKVAQIGAFLPGIRRENLLRLSTVFISPGKGYYDGFDTKGLSSN